MDLLIFIFLLSKFVVVFVAFADRHASPWQNERQNEWLPMNFHVNYLLKCLNSALCFAVVVAAFCCWHIKIMISSKKLLNRIVKIWQKNLKKKRN